MKKNSIRCLLAVAVAGSLYSCTKSNYNQLSQSELTWFIYEGTDQLIFENNTSGARDTFKLSRSHAYHRDGHTYDEYAYNTLTLLSDTLTAFGASGGLYLEKTSDGFTAKLSFPHHPKISYIQNAILWPDTINGTIIPDVYVSKADTLTTNLFFYYDKVFYSKTFGFIKLVDIWGDEWYRVN